MKKLLISTLASSLLFSTLALAQNPQPNIYHKVQIVNGNKKNFEKVIYKIGGFVFSIAASAIGNSDTVKKVVNNVETFFNHKSADHEEIIGHFGGQIKAELINTFKSRANHYPVYTPINFQFSLNQNAYVYLMSIDAKQSCLVYPNTLDAHPYGLAKGSHSIPSNANYSIKSDQAGGTENFYLISSVRPIYFDRFKAVGIYKCASRGVGLQKLEDHQYDQYSDYRHLPLAIR